MTVFVLQTFTVQCGTARGRAQQEATKQKRLNQMLDELERGGVYMNMKWNG